MKKTLVVLCSVVLILTYNFMVPLTVSAADCPPHVFSLTHEGPRHTNSSHQYKVSDGSNGPIYGTCYTTINYYGCYPRCSKCGYIDYANYYWENYVGTYHSACGL